MIGTSCATGGGPDGALEWASTKGGGIADSQCFEYIATDRFYFPCGDRPGRTVRIPKTTLVGSVEDQKRWLVNVGPLAACFTVYPDWYVYNFTAQVAYSWDGKGTAVGGHCVLVVGYDDAVGGWIFKNSWSRFFGDQGFGYIKYVFLFICPYLSIPESLRKLTSYDLILPDTELRESMTDPRLVSKTSTLIHGPEGDITMASCQYLLNTPPADGNLKGILI
jgi:hypothetical protein